MNDSNSKNSSNTRSTNLNRGATSFQRAPEFANPANVDQSGRAALDVDDRSLNTDAIFRIGSIVKERWFTGVLAFGLAFAPVVAHSIFVIPDYMAEGTVQVATDDALQANAELKELLGGSNSQMETEVEIMRRKDFLLGVAKKLRLNVQDPNQAKAYTDDLEITLEGKSPVSPELYAMREAISMCELDSAHSGTFDLEVRVDAHGQLKARTDAALGYTEWTPIELHTTQIIGPLKIEFAKLPLQKGQEKRFRILGDASLVRDVLSRVAVNAVGSTRNPTNLVQVSFTDTDRFVARSFVLSILEQYVQQSLEWKTESAGRAAEFIRSRVDEASAQLADREGRLEDFAKSSSAVQLDEQAKSTITEMATVEDNLRSIEMQIQLAESVLANIGRGGLGKNLNLTSGFSDDPVLQASIQSLVDAETQLSLISATMTDDHPRVLEQRNQVRLRQQELQGLVRSSLKTLKKKQASLRRDISVARSRLAQFPEQEIELARRTRGVQVTEKLHGFLLQKLQDAEILRASASTDKRIVDRPYLPDRPSRPQRPLILAAGAVLASAFALMTIFITHLLRRRISSTRELRERVPFPQYGSIPEDRRLEGSYSADDLQEETIEAFRNLAINVSMAHRHEDRGQSIAITSARQGEGRSLIASQLAFAMARTGSRVLLMDLDLRDPDQHLRLPGDRAPGYSDWHTQGGGLPKLQDFIRRIDEHNVDILTAGSAVADPTSTLDARKIRSTIAYLSSIYDHILIDAPSTKYGDVRLLSYVTDLTLLVARPGTSTRTEIRQAVAAASNYAAICGLVVTDDTDAKGNHDYLGDHFPNHLNKLQETGFESNDQA